MQVTCYVVASSRSSNKPSVSQKHGSQPRLRAAGSAPGLRFSGVKPQPSASCERFCFSQKLGMRESYASGSVPLRGACRGEFPCPVAGAAPGGTGAPSQRRASPRPPALRSGHPRSTVTPVRSDAPHFKNRGDTTWNSWTPCSSCLLGPGEQRAPRGVSAPSQPGPRRTRFLPVPGLPVWSPGWGRRLKWR